MKRLNVKLLVILIVSFTVLTVGSVVVWNLQMYRHSDKALRRANEAYTRGELEPALDDMERYLGLNPNDNEQIVRLAEWRQEWFDEGGDIQPLAVRESLNRAVDVDEENLDLRRITAKFDMKLGLWQDAVAHWRKIIEMEGEGGSIDSRLSEAESYYYSDQTDRDQQVENLLAPMIGLQIDGTFNEALATAPGQAKAYELLATLYSERRLNEAMAEQIMRMAVHRNPQSAEVYLALSRYLSNSNPATITLETVLERRKEAIQAAEAAYALDPESADVILQVASIKAEGGDLELAQQILEKGLKSHPENVMMIVVQAEILSRLNRAEEGLALVESSLLAMPGNIELVNKKFTLEIQAGHPDDAALTLEQLKKLNAPADLRLYYAGEVAFAKQEWAKAREIYEEVRPSMENRRGTLATAIDQHLWWCYEVLGLPDLQLSTIQRMRQTNNAPELLRRQAMAFGKMGRQDLAEEQLDALLAMEDFEEFPNPVLVQEQAIRLKIDRIMRSPEDQRDWSRVDELLEIVAPADSEKISDIFFRYSMLRARQENEAASAELDRALELDPENEQLWMAKIREMSDDIGAEEALEQLEIYEAAHDDSPSVRGTRALLLTVIGGENLPEKLLALESGVDSWEEDERGGLWEQLANAHLRVNSWRQALVLLDRVAEQQKQRLDVRMRMFEIALSVGDEAAMVDTLGRIEELVGKNDSNWKIQEARRQIWLYRNDQGGDDALARARRLVDSVHNDRPYWHVNSRIQAELALQEGQIDPAILNLQEALQNGPRDLTVMQKLLELLINENRVTEAHRLLSNVGEAELNDPLRRLQLVLDADAAQKNEDKEETAALLARMDELVPLDSEDPNEIVFRARMLVSLGDLEAAEASYRRATELAPNASAAWVQLVSFLAQQGRLEEAEQTALEAQMRLPETDVPLAMGQMYLLVGKYAWAELFYKMAVDAHPESSTAQRTIAAFYLTANRIDRATPYLNQILAGADPEAESTSADVMWARREVAKIFAARGSYQDYLTAVKLIEENSADQERMDDQDLALLTGLALARPETRSRSAAIALLEKRGESNDPMPDGLLLNLAKLYYSTNDVSKSRGLTQQLIRRYPDQQDIIAFYIRILWDEEDFNELNLRIKQLDSESYAFIELQSLIWAENGEVDRAAALVSEGLFPEGFDINDYAPEDQGRFRSGAQLFARLGQYDEAQYARAESLLRQFVREYEGYRLMLPAYLGERGGANNIKEAFDILGEIRGAMVETIRVTQTAVGILRANQDEIPPSSPYYEMVDSWFEIGEKETPGNRSLVIQRAGFEELRGDFTAALALYERSLSPEMGEIDFRQEALVNNNMAYLMVLNGECEKPLELVRNSIALVGPISTLLDTQAMSYLVCGDPQLAIADLDRAMLDGKEPVYLYHLALAHNEAQSEGLAQENLREALELGLRPHDLLRPEQKQLAELMNKFGIKLSDYDDTEGL